MSRRTRILIFLGILVVVCGTYLWFFGVQTFLALEARNIARQMPVVKNAPVELQDLSTSQAPGRRITYFGYEFDVPWDDIDEPRTRTIGGNRVVIGFRSGNSLSVWSGSPREFVDSVLASAKLDRESLRQMYGDEPLQSDYAFHHIMLEVTPDKITPFMSKGQAISQSMLIIMKGISAPIGADPGIPEVRTGEFRGFQYGRPQSSPSGLSVELFSDSGSISFIFGQKVNGSTVIFQPDISRILQTIHKLPANTMALKAEAQK